MGVMFLKYKLSIFLFLLLLLSASLFSSTIVAAGAGRFSKLVHKAAAAGDVKHEDVKRKKTTAEMEDIHERLLRANTKDYGRYDPAPAFVKPPFKLIPN